MPYTSVRQMRFMAAKHPKYFNEARRKAHAAGVPLVQKAYTPLGIQNSDEDLEFPGSRALGAGLLVSGAAQAPGLDHVLERQLATASPRERRAVLAAMTARNQGILPASRAVGGAARKVQVVDDLVRTVPPWARPFILMSSGAALLTGHKPGILRRKDEG